jgi:prepilin-type N-terminal cleavage/methylation domain-containing protein
MFGFKPLRQRIGFAGKLCVKLPRIYSRPLTLRLMHPRVCQSKTIINANGFSLLELLVVVAIIGVLAAIAIPQFVSYRARAVDSQMKSDLKNAALAMDSYFAENKEYPTSLAAIVSVGFNQTEGVALTIAVPTPSSFTITAAKPSGTQPNFTFNSVTGNIN